MMRALEFRALNGPFLIFIYNKRLVVWPEFCCIVLIEKGGSMYVQYESTRVKVLTVLKKLNTWRVLSFDHCISRLTLYMVCVTLSAT